MQSNVVYMNKNQHKFQNIIDVDIPAFMYERVSSGTTWVDNLLTEEGGFIPTFVHMVSGMSGAGKSTLLRQLADGFTSQGHVVVYNSAEESKEQIAIAIKKRNLKNGFIIKNHNELDAIIKTLNEVRQSFPDKRVVLILDSIQTLEDNPGDVIKKLTAWTKNNEAVTFLVSQVTKAGAFAGKNKMLHDIDVHIDLRISYGNRLLFVRKNRGGATIDDPIGYMLTSEGVVPELEPLFNEDTKPTTKKAPHAQVHSAIGSEVLVVAGKNRVGEIATVMKVGRTRVTVALADGEVLYIPFDHIEVRDAS